MQRLLSILRKAILGSMVATKATGAVMSPGLSEDTWQPLRRHLNQEDSQAQDPRPEISISGLSADTREALYAAVRNSYLQTHQEDWSALDEHWSSHPLLRSDAQAFRIFLQARSSLHMHLDSSREEILQNWLHKAQGTGDPYDSGNNGNGNGNGNGGNGNNGNGNGGNGNNGNGKGNGGGNGTGSEGGKK